MRDVRPAGPAPGDGTLLRAARGLRRHLPVRGCAGECRRAANAAALARLPAPRRGALPEARMRPAEKSL